MTRLTLPAIGGSRTGEQLEALARKNAGVAFDAEQLHPDDRPKEEPAAAPAADATAPDVATDAGAAASADAKE